MCGGAGGWVGSRDTREGLRGGEVGRWVFNCQAFPVLKHHHPGIWGSPSQSQNQRSSCEGEKALDSDSGVQDLAVLWGRPGQGQVMSPCQASVSPSVIDCVPVEARAAGRDRVKRTSIQRVGSFPLSWPPWGLGRDGASSPVPGASP